MLVVRSPRNACKRYLICGQRAVPAISGAWTNKPSGLLAPW